MDNPLCSFLSLSGTKEADKMLTCAHLRASILPLLSALNYLARHRLIGSEDGETYFPDFCNIFLPSVERDPDQPKHREMANNNLINWGLQVMLFGSIKKDSPLN